MRQTRILRGKNLFIFLSFLGVALLGLALLGFWYLIQPRLGEIYSELPFIVGIGFLGLYLAIVGLFIVIVLSSFIRRDLISAKKITVRILFPLASAIGRVLGIQSDEIRGSFIEMNNALVRTASRLIEGDRLLLLLPHCLQNFDCPHRVTAEVRNCERCGKCEIADLLAMCDSYGIKMSIATGGTLARRVIVETRPRAIVAVACERDLTGGIQEVYPIPVIGVLNDRPHGPCRDTRVDLSKVEGAISFFLQRVIPRAGGPAEEGEPDVAVCGGKSDKTIRP